MGKVLLLGFMVALFGTAAFLIVFGEDDDDDEGIF